MSSIEQRFEVRIHEEPDYVGRVLSDDDVKSGAHRKWVGGHWDDHGLRQLEFLVSQGLEPATRFLDVGCGSFRAGRHLVDHLLPGHYYGIDANQSVMQAGYDVELAEEQRQKLPVESLRATDRFDVDFGVMFDMGIAQSVFTHVSLNHIRLCLYRVAQVMRPGGRFFTTFNERPSAFPIDGVVPSKHPKYSERNVYWYYRSDIRWAAKFSPWEYRYIGKWGHPGGQRMIEFTRRADPEEAAEPGFWRQLRSKVLGTGK